MVAGLETTTAGLIELGGQDISDLKPYKRPVNTVFQSYALFPHLDIFENVAFGLRRTKSKEVKAKVGEMLELVQLQDYAKRRPNQLSGGQQQRVALARALINRPQVLLLDEPLGALDLKLRRAMQLELKRIQTEVGLTFIHVTHDQEEAMTMADTVAVMNRGHIEQLGPPAHLYDLPRTRFVANFLGQANTGVGAIEGTDGDHLVADVFGTKVKIAKARSQVHDGEVLFGVRPEKVTVSRHQPDGVGNDVKGVVRDVSFLGVATSYLVDMPSGATWSCYEQNLDVEPIDLRPGDEVWLTWNPGHAFGVPVEDE
jgi:spermidine/putrescine transport system ATP-binding protein